MVRLIVTVFLAMITLLSACKTERKSEGVYTAGFENIVAAIKETAAMKQDVEEDSADDPAIWINPESRSKSVVYGSDKKGGIAAYDLDGKLLKYYAVGNINNIDIRQNCIWNNDTIDVLAGSNRSDNSIIVFRILPAGDLYRLTKTPIKCQMTEEVYGFCLYQNNSTKELFAFINSKEGTIEQWCLNCNKHVNQMSGELVLTHKLNTQVEGMVADDANDLLYVGEEVRGIWRFDINKRPFVGTQLTKSSAADNDKIVYDIEGLAIYKTGATSGYLLASIQGNYSFAIYNREAPNAYITSFVIGKGNDLDGVEETDGIEVFCDSLCVDFPKGVLVVQDGFNMNNSEEKQPQNFKYIDWRQIEAFLN